MSFFNVDAAKKAGYTDKQIQDYITQNKLQVGSDQHFQQFSQQQQEQTQQPQQEQGLTGNSLVDGILGLGKAVVQPIAKAFYNTGANTLEAGNQLQRFTTDPTFRQSVLSDYNLANKPSDQQLAQSGLANQPISRFVPEQNLSTQGKILDNSVKDAATIGSLAVPGGEGALGVLGAGALSGGLYGYGTSEKGKELGNTVTGALAGGATAGVLRGLPWLFNKFTGKGAQQVATDVASKTAQSGTNNALSEGIGSDIANAQEQIAKFKPLADKGDEAAKSVVNTMQDFIDQTAKKQGGNQAINSITQDAAQSADAFVPPYTKATPEVKAYLSSFTVPTKLSKNLRPQDTAEKMLKYGVNGSLDEIGNTAAQVTGNQGFISKLQRDVIAKAPQEIDIGDALSGTRNSLDKIAELTDNEDSRIMSAIRKMLPAGENPNSANSLDVFDSIKNLEDLGHQYLDHSTYINGNLKNQQIGNVYLGVAENLKDTLEKSIKSNGLVKPALTPEILNQAAGISPRLADDLSKATTLGDLRSIQAPFVRIQRMVDLTNQAQQSSFQNLAGQVKGLGKYLPTASNPLAFLEPLLSSPEVNTKAAGVLSKLRGGAQAGATQAAQQGVAQGAQQVASNGANALSSLPFLQGFSPAAAMGAGVATGAGQPQQPLDQSQQNDSQQPQDQISQQGNGQQNGGFQVTPQMLKAARLALPDKEYKKLEDIYKLQIIGIGGTSKVSETAREKYNMAKTGLKAVADVKRMFDANPNIAAYGAFTNGLATRQFDSAAFRAVDAMLRLRTGVAAPDAEIRNYMKTYTPALGESREDSLYKINALKSDLQDALSGFNEAQQQQLLQGLNNSGIGSGQ